MTFSHRADIVSILITHLSTTTMQPHYWLPAYWVIRHKLMLNLVAMNSVETRQACLGSFSGVWRLCVAYLTYPRPGKLTLMFTLLILPEKLPHLEVYEQAWTDKSKQHSLRRIIQVSRPACLFRAFISPLVRWEGYLLFACIKISKDPRQKQPTATKHICKCYWDKRTGENDQIESHLGQKSSTRCECEWG